MKTGRKINLSITKKYFLHSFAFLALAALFLTFFIEYRYFINSFESTWEFVFSEMHVFLYNVLIVWLFLVLLWCLCGKPILSVAITTVTIIIVSYIHICKFNSRGYPLLPDDFLLAGEATTLTKFIDPWSIVRLVIAIIMTCVLFVVFSKKCGKRLLLSNPRDSKSLWRRHLFTPRALLLVASCGALLLSTNFARHNNGSNHEATFLGTEFTAWNQNTNYSQNGFIIGFLYNLQKPQIKTPDYYSEEMMQKIHNYYEDIANKENAERIDPSTEDTSLVIILNESFYDLNVQYGNKNITDLYPYTGGDVLPDYHALQKRTPSGSMYSIDYGGGTANIEFEAYTSMTNFWLNVTPYTALIPKAGNVPSVVSMLKNRGYKTTAIHPFNGNMYKRNISLKNEGFDTFIAEAEMDYKEHDGNSEYINDKSAYNQVLKTLRENGPKQVIGLVTMQNHTPYFDYIYEKRDYNLVGAQFEDYEREEFSAYTQSLHNSDKYLGEFLDELDNLEQNVVVLFYGDHAPGIFSYLGKSPDETKTTLSRLTPYFFYSNSGRDLGDAKLPLTTPNCIVNTLLNRLNWQKDAFYYLVDKVCESTPILSSTYYNEREFIQTTPLSQYNLYIYDFLAGKKYWQKD